MDILKNLKNAFSFSRNQAGILITLIFLGLIGAFYYYYYIPVNQQSVQQEHYRCLQNIEKNFHDKVENSVALLSSVLNAEGTARSATDKEAQNTVRDYIKGYTRKNFILDTISNTKAPDSTATINENDSAGFKISLSVRKRQIGMCYTIKQFFEALLPHQTFDEYLVLKNKTIVYQTFESGMNTIEKDSIQTPKNAFKKKEPREIQIGGTVYKAFLQNLKTKSGDIYVIGLLTAKNYKAETSKLPENAVLLLMVLAMGIFLALPWIKLYQMGNQERLTVTDGLFSFGVPMLLLPLLFFSFLKYNASLRPALSSSDLIKKNLANWLEGRFKAELRENYLQLKKLDSIRHIANITADLDSGSLKGDTLKKQIKQIFVNGSINQAYWIRRDGNEVNNWTIAKQNTPGGYYAARDYFDNVKNRKAYFLDNDSSRQYYLQQLTSWTTGTFASVIAIPSVNPGVAVAALSFNFKCFDDPVLPEGFQYAFVNHDGEVLYHADTTKNLNENIFQEVSASQQMRALVLSRDTGTFVSHYAGKIMNVFVKPVSFLPYSIVILEDTSYKNMRDVKIFAFCFYMLLAFFLFLVFQMLVIYAACQRNSFLKKQYFDISWLRPNTGFHHQYNVATVGNSYIIILLIIFYFFCSFLQYLLILCISATAVTLFVNQLYLYKYKGSGGVKYILKRRAAIVLLCFAGLINIAAAILIDFDLFFLFERFIFLGAVLFFWFDDSLSAIFQKLRTFLRAHYWDFSWSYSLMIFTRLIITSGMPVILFYIAANNYQGRITCRYRQQQFAQAVMHKYQVPNQDDLAKTFNDGCYVANKYIIPHDSIEKDHFSLEQRVTVAMLSTLSHISIDTSAIDKFYNISADTALNYSGLFANRNVYAYYTLPARPGVKHTGFDILQPDSMKATLPLEQLNWRVTQPALLYFEPAAPIKILRMFSLSFDYSLPNVLQHNGLGWYFWILFLLSLLIFWLIIHKTIGKLFALNLPHKAGWPEINDMILTNPQLNPLLFILGSPGAGKMRKIEYLIRKNKIRGKNGELILWDDKNESTKNYMVIDMLLIPNNRDEPSIKEWDNLKEMALKKNYALIIINHFEYDIKNPFTNQIKLDLLEALLQRADGKVFIVSTVHPVSFLESLGNGQQPDDSGPRKAEYDLERWHVLLGHFRIVIEPLQSSQYKKTGIAKWEQTVFHETEHGHFLNKLSVPILTTLKNTQAEKGYEYDGESLAYKIQITGHYFYMYIWQSLTKEEKFLLYDLAEDSLVNAYDDYNLSMLISKGLIIRKEGGLFLFNKGFRNFILTAIGTTEAMQIRKQIRDTGNWSRFRGPLVIMTLAVFLFLMTSQQEAYSSILTYIGIATAGFPTIMKFFSLFQNNGAKSS